MADQATERFTARVPGLLAELERRAAALFDIQLTPAVTSLPDLERITAFLYQMRASFDAQDRQINVLLVGTYMGEIERRERGGAWRVDAGRGLPVVDLPDGAVFDPMTLAAPRLSASAPTLTASRGGT
jgi:hypothetical protein